MSHQQRVPSGERTRRQKSERNRREREKQIEIEKVHEIKERKEAVKEKCSRRKPGRERDR